MNHQQKNIKHTYSKEIRAMFTKIICDIESLQHKIIISSQYQSGACLDNGITNTPLSQ